MATTLCAGALAAATLFPPITQNPHYHDFADQRTILGIPNFWNVASNLAFLLVALRGLRAFRSPNAFEQNWERIAYATVLAGLVLVTAGSSWYHLHPDDATLVWDRLPMTILFMSLLAITIGERIDMRAGRLLWIPLLALGVASVLYWRGTGDLRPYVLVQFFPMLVLPALFAMLPSRYTRGGGLWWMVAFYGLAKLVEWLDRPLATLAATGGHPWKHVFAAIAMLCYIDSVIGRRYRSAS